MEDRMFWQCPHCLDGLRTLSDAVSHMGESHADCVSCGAEILLTLALIEGEGEFEIPEHVPPHKLS